MEELKKYEIVSLDVWGNEKDGFEINCGFYTGAVITIDPYDNKDIIRKVRQAGYVNKALPYQNFEIEGDPEFELTLYYSSRRLGQRYPVCSLDPMKEA
jgi:hypothetical protein